MDKEQLVGKRKVNMEERYGTQLYIEYLERYKNAWEELKNKLEKIIATTESMQVHDYVNYVCADMQELE